MRVFCFSVLLCTALCGFLPSAASAHHASTGRRRFARTLNIVLPSSHEGMSRGLDVPEGFRAFDLSAPAGKRNRSVLFVFCCCGVSLSLSLSLIVSALCMYVCDACFVLVPPPLPPRLSPIDPLPVAARTQAVSDPVAPSGTQSPSHTYVGRRGGTLYFAGHSLPSPPALPPFACSLAVLMATSRGPPSASLACFLWRRVSPL